MDEAGELLFEVVRKANPKTFRQRRPNGRGGWIWNLKGIQRVLYRLPEVIAAVEAGNWIFVVEGEKDADNLAKLGLAATTNAGGAEKWRPEFSEVLRGAHVAILPDNDKPGSRHAQAVALSLADLAAEIRIVELPDLPPGGDVSDWIAGHLDGADAAEAVCQKTAEVAPWSGPVAKGSEPSTEIDSALVRLAALEEPLDFATVERLLMRIRDAAANQEPLKRALVRERTLGALKNKLRSPASVVDAALGATARTNTQGEGSGVAISFQTAEPWPESVNGSELLGEIRISLRSYLILPEGAATAMALWVLHTYTFGSGWISPRLAITSPVKRCAKTLALTMLDQLVARPLMVANITPAALFRSIEHFQPTLLIDEADTFLHGKDELRGILNSGHRRDGSVLRVAGDDHEPRRFSTFAPVAIAKIGKLPDTLSDRSIEIGMRRKSPGETVTKLRLDRLDHFKPWRRRCTRWAQDHEVDLRKADPATPPGLHDRAADNWRPLLAIAELAEGAWPDLAWRAIELLNTNDGSASASDRENLLADIRVIFEVRGAEALFTDQLLAELWTMKDRPWPEWRNGTPLSPVQLARLLKDFNVKPRSTRIASASRKGYRLADFEEAFRRYLPLEASHPSQLNQAEGLRSPSTRHTVSSVTPCEAAQNPANPGIVTGVTGQSAGQAPDEPDWLEVPQ